MAKKECPKGSVQVTIREGGKFKKVCGNLDLLKDLSGALGVTEREFQAVLDNSYLDCSRIFDGRDEVRACEAAAQDVWMRSLSFLKDKKRPDFSAITPRVEKNCSKSEEMEACKAGLDIVHKRMRKVNFEMGRNRRKGNT